MTSHTSGVTGPPAPGGLDGLVSEVEGLLEYDMEAAEARADEAKAVAERAGVRRDHGCLLHLRAWARFSLGNVGDALRDQLAALEYLKISEDEEGIGLVLGDRRSMRATFVQGLCWSWASRSRRCSWSTTRCRWRSGSVTPR